MSAQVTEAHRELACTLTGRHYSISEAAELIADSEAAAILKETGYLKAMVQDGTNAMKERDQLRALLVYADQILDDIDTCSDAHKPMYSSYSQNVMKLCIKGREARRAVLDSAIKKETT